MEILQDNQLEFDVESNVTSGWCRTLQGKV